MPYEIVGSVDLFDRSVFPITHLLETIERESSSVSYELFENSYIIPFMALVNRFWNAVDDIRIAIGIAEQFGIPPTLQSIREDSQAFANEFNSTEAPDVGNVRLAEVFNEVKVRLLGTLSELIELLIENNFNEVPAAAAARMVMEHYRNPIYDLFCTIRSFIEDPDDVVETDNSDHDQDLDPLNPPYDLLVGDLEDRVSLVAEAPSDMLSIVETISDLVNDPGSFYIYFQQAIEQELNLWETSVSIHDLHWSSHLGASVNRLMEGRSDGRQILPLIQEFNSCLYSLRRVLLSGMSRIDQEQNLPERQMQTLKEDFWLRVRGILEDSLRRVSGTIAAINSSAESRFGNEGSGQSTIAHVEMTDRESTQNVHSHENSNQQSARRARRSPLRVLLDRRHRAVEPSLTPVSDYPVLDLTAEDENFLHGTQSLFRGGDPTRVTGFIEYVFNFVSDNLGEILDSSTRTLYLQENLIRLDYLDFEEQVNFITELEIYLSTEIANARQRNEDLQSYMSQRIRNLHRVFTVRFQVNNTRNQIERDLMSPRPLADGSSLLSRQPSISGRSPVAGTPNSYSTWSTPDSVIERIQEAGRSLIQRSSDIVNDPTLDPQVATVVLRGIVAFLEGNTQRFLNDGEVSESLLRRHYSGLHEDYIAPISDFSEQIRVHINSIITLIGSDREFFVDFLGRFCDSLDDAISGSPQGIATNEDETDIRPVSELNRPASGLAAFVRPDEVGTEIFEEIQGVRTFTENLTERDILDEAKTLLFRLIMAIRLCRSVLRYEPENFNAEYIWRQYPSANPQSQELIGFFDLINRIKERAINTSVVSARTSSSESLIGPIESLIIVLEGIYELGYD